MTNLHPEGHPAYVGLPTYLQAPYARDADELRASGADVAVLGAPVDMGTSNRSGARMGPRAIRQAAYFGMASTSLYHIGLDVDPLDHIKVVDFGDANCPPSSLELSHEAVKAKAREALDAGAVPIVLGGDHSITLPSATAAAEAHGFGRVGMVHFDAHADTGESSYGGVLIAHGNPMRRLIESGAIPGPNFVQVGLRGYWPPRATFEWMQQQGMRWHRMADIEQRGFDRVISDAIAQALEGPELLYLSVDIDVADPGIAPGTGTPEPGGLSAAELLRAVRRIVASDVRLVAMDIVEVAPAYDGPGEATAQLAHRVAMEAISALAWKRAQGRG